MQMFNGCTMGVIGRYRRINFNNLESGNKGTVDKGTADRTENYEVELNNTIEQFNKITEKLTNKDKLDDNQAKKEGMDLINSLSNNLNYGAEKYFKENPESLRDLKVAVESSINKIKMGNGWEELPVEYKPLQDFLGKINQLLPDSPVVEQLKTPEFSLKDVDLDIKDVANEIGDQNFFKGKNETVGINEKAGDQDKSKVDETKKDLEDQIADIKAIDQSKLPDNVKGDINQLNKLLENIKNVLNNVTPDNVKRLQKFISENLTEEERIKFNTASYSEKNKEFDGKFGSGTLEGLNIILKNTGEYIKNTRKYVDDAKKSEQSGTHENPLDKEKEKTGDATVNLVDSTDTAPVQPSLDTKPLSFDGNQYQVMDGNTDLVSQTKLQGVTFYSTLPYTNIESETGKPTLSSTTKENNGEKEYYVKLSNSTDNNIYKVRVDINGNLNPIVECGSKRILIKNNTSCMQYLADKLPTSLPGNPRISWDRSLNDYVIYSETNRGTKGLTIEPVTIDGNRVVDGNKDTNHLSKSLTLLNFTNILRGAETIYDVVLKNDNPDLTIKDGQLYVRVNRKSNKKISKKENREKGDLGWKWQQVNKNSFGLSDMNDETLKKFIKYNNREDWNDNWDKKDNNNYNKIDFPPIVINSSNTTNTPTSKPTSTTHTTEQIVSGDVKNGKELDENIISKIGLSKLENSDNIVKIFAIPDNAIVYGIKDKKGYYYKEGNKVFCVGNNPEQEWKKWEVSGDNYQTHSEYINVCSEGSKRLGLVLEDSLKELKDSGLIDDNESEKISIKIENNQYTLVNGEKKLSIDDYFLKGSNTKDNLKMVCLASKIAPGEFELGDGGIMVKEYQDNGDKGDKLVLSKDKFSEIGINDENINKYVEYLNNIPEELVNDEKPVEDKKNPVVTDVVTEKGDGVDTVNKGSITVNTGRVVEQKQNKDPENVAQYGFKSNALSNDQSKKADLGIPSGNKYVYTKGNDGYFYYKEGNNFVGVNSSQPYFKVETNYSGLPIRRKLNLCKAGESSLNSKVNGMNSEYNVSLTNEGYKFSCLIPRPIIGEMKSVILNEDDVNNILSNNVNKVVDKVHKENNYWRDNPRYKRNPTFTHSGENPEGSSSN